MEKVPVIAIVGPTASGKSELAVMLSKKFNGEVISADSRQVYRGLDIGTGKVPRDRIKNQELRISASRRIRLLAERKSKDYYHRGIRHHLLDVADPKKQLTVVDYQKLARKAVREIARRGKIPVICGGTGLYIDALLYDIQFPSAPVNTVLRKKLERLETKKLFAMLRAKNFLRAKTIDPNNRRRLIRALEIIYAGKNIPKLDAPIFSAYAKLEKWQSPYDVLIIGIRREPNELRARIDRRLKDRLVGIIREVKKLHASGIAWKRLEGFGLEYRWGALFVQKKLPPHAYENPVLAGLHVAGFSKSATDALYSILRGKIWQYAKRQLTWLKRNPNIVWIKSEHAALSAAQRYVKTAT